MQTGSGGATRRHHHLDQLLGRLSAGQRQLGRAQSHLRGELQCGTRIQSFGGRTRGERLDYRVNKCGAASGQRVTTSIVRADLAFGSLAMISRGAQTFFNSNPRMTELASFPAPMKPKR